MINPGLGIDLGQICLASGLTELIANAADRELDHWIDWFKNKYG